MCVFLSAAPFTPAVLGSLILMCVAGVYGLLKCAKVALALLCFTTLAIIASPIMDIGAIPLWWVFLPYSVGFGGTAWGLHKSANN